jgi:hypothetical protein
MLAEVAEEAGFPAGVINVVTHAPGLIILDDVDMDYAVRTATFSSFIRVRFV